VKSEVETPRNGISENGHLRNGKKQLSEMKSLRKATSEMEISTLRNGKSQKV
jgi:hypothetical protein